MTSEMIQYLVIGAFIGVILGVISSGYLNPKLRRFNKVQKELEATKQELQTQKQMIAKHFAHSAELLDNLAKDFRHFYQHMAENSNSLLADNESKESISLDLNIPETSPAIQLEEPPKDYSGQPSGLLKSEAEHK